MLSVLATQNFDGLHEKAGNTDSVIVNLHGTIATSHCMSCHKKYDTADIMDTLDKDPDPCRRRLPYKNDMPCNWADKNRCHIFRRGFAGRCNGKKHRTGQAV